ncbi:MAG: septation protein SepH [Nocardioidaceae bacterium]
MKEQDLTLVGLTEDKQKLVLVSDAGEEFTLPADARLRAALRGEHARLGQLEITMESALRPRDIQARIRAGESPEAVAAAAQTSLEKIMGYATPVLAERAHIAERAQRASVRRKATDGPARILGDAVAERLRTRNVDPSTVEWDAWRREDGRWALVADYRSGESARHAEFVFDAPGRYVVAEDDEARWLIGEQSTSKGPQPRTSSGPRRLASVDSHGDDVELPLGDDAIDLVSDEGPEPTEPTEDLTATAAAIRETGDADWIATQATERPAAPATEEPANEPETSSDEADAEPEAQPDTGRRGAKKKSRASVPSWDEIMFGGGKRE